MSDEHIRRLKDTFKSADVNGDGELSIQEVKKVMEKCGCKLSDPEIASLFCNDDTDQDSKISFDEFAAACNKRDPKAIKKEELRAVFQDLDVDKSGALTTSDMKTCLCGKVSDEDAEQMIKEVDKDNNGKVNFEEFLVMWESKLCQ